MTATTCARCEFRATEEEPLAVHAIGSGHPLCAICLRSLAGAEPRVCEGCLQHAQSLLSGIVTMYGELPDHLGHLHGWHPQTGRSSDGPIMGGTVLVLLGPGSPGYDEDSNTSLEGDRPSIAYELAWWAMGWADTRQDMPADQALLWMQGSPAGIMMRAAGYLETKMRWAATSHPAFDTFTSDLRRLHGLLERATGGGRVVEKAEADCFVCGGDLVQDTVTVMKRAGRQGEGPMRVGEVPTDDLSHTCETCHRRYTPAEYRMALRAAWASVEAWVPLVTAARDAGLNVETVEKWAARNQVATACPVDGGRKLVWWPDVQARTRKAAS